MEKLLHSVIAALIFLTATSTSAPGMAQTSLDTLLDPYLSRYGLPAIAAAVVKNGKIIAAGAVGTRRTGFEVPVTIHDRFHLGSDTKAMTALLAAMFVEEGKLRWDSTIAEVFPELADTMDLGLRDVTLVQLLSHTGGLPSDNETFGKLIDESLSQEGNLDALRYWLLRQWSGQSLASKPGVKFAYSNMDYVIVGTMIERVGKKTWDELITDRVFKPLMLNTAGLGCQSSLGRIDAPLGHAIINGKPRAFLAGPNGDNPPIIGPAGIAHMSILDFARWAGWNAGEGKRGPHLVKPETMRKLHRPVISMPLKKDAAPGTPSHGGYALGWGEVSVDWAPAPLLYHGGSNGKNIAHIWIDGNNDLAIVTATNIGGQKADAGLFVLARELFVKFAGKDGKVKHRGK